MWLDFARLGMGVGVRSLFSRRSGHEYLSRELAKIPGIPGKLGQFLSVRFGVDSAKAQPFSLSLEEVKAVLVRENPRFAETVSEIDPEAHSASLGQVHRVRLKQGEERGVKVQFPGVSESLGEQIEALLGLFAKSPLAKGRDVDLPAYREFLMQYFQQELDYRLEAQNQIDFYNAYRDLEFVKIPKVYTNHSTARILVQDWLPSTPLRTMRQWDESSRKRVGNSLVRFVLHALLEKGLVHGDFHPGNWGALPPGDGLVLYDFGSVLRLGQNQREALRELFFERDSKRLFEVWIALGFDVNRFEPLRDRVLPLTQALMDPFLAVEGFDARDWNLSAQLDRILGVDKWWFRTAGPPWFLMLMRGLHGVFAALSSLEVRVETGLKTRSVPLPRSSSETPIPNRGILHVQVYEFDRITVEVELPARAAEDLRSVVPDDVIERLQSQGIDLDQIQQDVFQTGLSPRVLFDAQLGEKRYRVGLE